MFNFPSIEDRFLNIKNILSKTTEAEIFRHFLGFDYKIGKFYNSPLRDKDLRPSFNIYISNNGLRYKDFGHSQGTCFDFVKHLRNTDFFGALTIISNEMNLNLLGKKVSYKSYESMPINKTEKYTRCRLRHWDKYDKNYWSQYSISSESLERFDVKPAKELWYRKTGQSWQRIWINIPDNPMYVFMINEFILKEDNIIFGEYGLKIYRPLQTEEYDRDPTYKWFTGLSGNYIQGLKQLPENGDLLFITSSLKDVITLYQIGIPAIAPNAENSYISELLMENLKKRFNRIYVNYDSDDTGVQASLKFTEQQNLLYWNVPKSYNAKDVSDLVKKTNQEVLKKELFKKNVL